MKFNLKSLTPFVCFIVIIFFSSGVLAKTSFSLYKNDSKGFSIKYPSAWEKRENINQHTSFMALSPPESSTDNFRENVNVVTEAAAGYSLKKYYDANLGPMTKGLTGFKILSKGNKTIDKSPSKWVIYTHSYNGVPLKVKAYFFHNGNNGMVYTATASPKSFKKYEPVFDEIISTLKLK